MRPVVISMVLVVSLCSRVNATDRYADPGNLNTQLGAAGPGDRVILAPGNYGHVWLQNKNGTADQLIQIVAQDPGNRPVFLNPGSEGFQIADCSYLLFDGLIVRGASSEGFHLQFTGSSPPANPTNHIIMRNCQSDGMPTSGNTDNFKSDGTNNTLFYGCKTDSCGDSGFDFVGCRETLIMRSTMSNNGGGGIHPKGGSYNFGFYKNRFNAAGERDHQFGGSSGSAYYHQGNYNDPGYEAYDQVAMGNVTVGGWSAVAFTSSWHCDFKYNTIVDPTNYVMRILKEGGINQTSYNVFARNLVKAGVSTQNVGSNTQPATFTYADDFWSQAPSWDPGCSETGTVVGNPQLDGEYRPGNFTAKACGAHAPEMEAAWAAYTGRFAWAWAYASNYDPNAEAGGAYTIYKHGSLGGSVTLDASGSYAGNNPNAGMNANHHQNAISAYDWDLNGNNVFGDATGATPALTYAAMVGYGRGAAGAYQIELSILVDTDYDDIKDWDVAGVTVAEAYLGDADFNGHVDFVDYQALERNYGLTGRNWTQGDFDDDGDVDFSDYQALERQFGRVDAGDQSVPEPACLALLLAGALVRRRRRLLTSK
jgi:hypothetical protein